ncbi:MAG TPA: PEGA domain-containing protein [Thermoanaerobaculia bacterium]|nr:PEGA domain-containing protein [Thermoanaerobaculia bacterium]
MKMHRRAARRFFDHGAISALAAALLLTAALPGDAQQRQRPSDSGSSGRSVGSSGGGSSSGGSKGGSVSPSRPSSSSPSTPSARNTGSPERPRTAQPAGPSGGSEPRRQPPHRVRDGRGGGGHYYGGGYYGGYYYRPYSSFYYWPWYTPYWFYGPGGGGHYPYRDRGYVDRDTLGALDLDISPGRTEVYLDGQNIGIVDQFDGFPQYLWLEKGTYDLVFYREGYKTQARQISVYPGLVIGVDGRMERGESVRPEDLGPTTHERRDARIRDEEERRARIAAEEREERSEWRDRVRSDRDRWRDDPDDDGEMDEDEDDDGRRSASGDGWLRLDVEPADASVYVDGKFVGTGSEISELRSGLRLAPGRHKLAIVRPGHKAEETDFEVEAGESVELEIELDPYE